MLKIFCRAVFLRLASVAVLVIVLYSKLGSHQCNQVIMLFHPAILKQLKPLHKNLRFCRQPMGSVSRCIQLTKRRFIE